MDEESGGDEDIAKYLQDVIGGDCDDEFLDEFRNSDIFEEFLKDLSKGSRRPSNDSERDCAEGDDHSDSAEKHLAEDEQPNTESHADTSHSRDSETFRTHKATTTAKGQVADRPRKKETFRPGENVNALELGNKIREKLKISPRPTATSKKDKSPGSKQDRKNVKPQSKPTYAAVAATGTSSGNQQVTPTAHLSKNKTQKSESGSKVHVGTTKAVAKKRVLEIHVLLYKLHEMINLFPNGIQSVKLTPKILEDILNLDRGIRSEEERKRLSSHDSLTFPPKTQHNSVQESRAAVAVSSVSKSTHKSDSPHAPKQSRVRFQNEGSFVAEIREKSKPVQAVHSKATPERVETTIDKLVESPLIENSAAPCQKSEELKACLTVDTASPSVTKATEIPCNKLQHSEDLDSSEEITVQSTVNAITNEETTISEKVIVEEAPVDPEISVKVDSPSEENQDTTLSSKQPLQEGNECISEKNADVTISEAPEASEHTEKPLSPQSAFDDNIPSPAATSGCMDTEKLPPEDNVNNADGQLNIAHSSRSSPSQERILSKKKRFFESSSDDGDARKDDTDTASTPPERKKSSDDEQNRGNSRILPFERKREQVDCRSDKFDKLQDERQRKLSEKKKEKKEKYKEKDPLEEVFKEKPLPPSFRIPKKTHTSKTKNEARATVVATPLVVHDVPKENLRFERCRPGKDKDKDRGWDNDFRGSKPRFEGTRKEPEVYDRMRDDGRKPVLMGDIKCEPIPEPESAPILEPEPMWDDEPEGGGSCDDNVVGVTSDDKLVEDVEASVNAPGDEPNEEKESNKVSKETEQESEPAVIENFDPEVPLETVNVNAFAVGVVTLMQEGQPPEIPDIDEITNLAEITVMRLAWWFKAWESIDLDTRVNSPDSADGASVSDCSFLNSLDLTDSEDDSEISDKYSGRICDPVDEYCGRTLLNQAQYRSGPGEKFVRIFQIRSGGSYEKENFQARCCLCNKLVIGKIELALHILSDLHIEKMSTAGMEGGKSSEVGPSAEKKSADPKDKPPTKVDRNKKSESTQPSVKTAELNKKDLPEKKGSDKQKDAQKDKTGKFDEKNKKDQKGARDDKRSEKRKRSSERSPREKSGDSGEPEIGRTSTGLSVKIPPGAIPDRKNVDSRGRKSRSRSPHHKRTRSRSPHNRRSRSPRRKSRSRSPRKHKRSRTPIQRIPRSPTKVREQQLLQQQEQQRRRSTSRERVEKFLARTNRRPSSPSNGHVRKRHRRSRSKSPLGICPVVPKRDNREFHEKLALTADGKWTDEMEQRWKLMEAEEAIFMERFGESSNAVTEHPEKHPSYGGEWLMFWEQKYQEIEQQGKDPEKYDYIPDWKLFWGKRLKALLELEYETEIKEIKKRHGMDFETLQKLRSPEEPRRTPDTPSTPQPVPPPQVVPAPLPVPPPQLISVAHPAPSPQLVSIAQPIPSPRLVTVPQPALPQNPPSIALVSNSSTSKSASEVGDDFTARPMSVSDSGGEEKNQKGLKTNAVPKSSSSVSSAKAPVTAVDIISTWEKLKSGGVPTRQSTGIGQPSLPYLGTVQSRRSLDEKSNADSGSIASYDFDGFDLVQVLRLMSNLEDQLSFLAPKVREYFKMAEELELKKQNKSNSLLDDEDFVIMLFQVRDRFMAMIRANILPKEVLRSLNLTVYALNSILDAPQCQKHRPKLAALDQRLNEKTEEVNVSVSTNLSGTTNPNLTRDQIATALMKSSSNQKEKLALELSSYILSVGREDMTDKELREFVWKTILPPKEKKTNEPNRRVENPGAPPVQKSTRGTETQVADKSMDLEKDPWSLPDKNLSTTFSVASSRAAGTAFPSLPSVAVALSNDSGDDSNNHSRGERKTPESGRRSPFSNRDYTGNPVSSFMRDQEQLRLQSNHMCGDTRLNATLDVPFTTGSSSLMRKARFKQNLHELQRHIEITMDLLTKKIPSHQNGESANLDNEQSPQTQPPKEPEDGRELPRFPPGILNMILKEAQPPKEPEDDQGLPRFPPGILNMIMKEKERKMREGPTKSNQRGEVCELGEIVSEEEPLSSVRERKKKRKRKRKKRKKARDKDSDSDSSSDSNEWTRVRNNRKSKRYQKTKRSKKDDRRYSRSPSVVRSENSSIHCLLPRIAPPQSDSDCEILGEQQPSTSKGTHRNNKSLLRESNERTRLGYRVDEVISPPVSPPLSFGSMPSRGKEKTRSTGSRVFKQKSNSEWDSLSETASNCADVKRKTFQKQAQSNDDNNASDKARHETRNKMPNKRRQGDAKVKVTPVAQTFWALKDDEKSICSIISSESYGDTTCTKNQQLAPEKIRMYRSSVDHNNEKEPGEISSESE